MNMEHIDYYEKFDSIEQMLSIMATRTEINEPWKYAEPSHDDNSKFRGTSSWEEACELAVNGDTKSWKLLSADYATVQSQKINGSYKAKLEYAVCGGCVDVPRYLSGNPACMIQRVRNKKTAKVMNLIYSISADCEVKTREMSAFGAKVLRAVQLIEEAGIKVNVYVTVIAGGDDEYASPIVNIKPSNIGVSPYSAAFGLVNPSMLRRLIFRWLETLPGLPQNWPSYYGKVVVEDMYQDRGLGKYAFIGYKNDNRKNVQELIDTIIEQVSRR